jgi:hypothetical protein
MGGIDRSWIDLILARNVTDSTYDAGMEDRNWHLADWHAGGRGALQEHHGY